MEIEKIRQTIARHKEIKIVIIVDIGKGRTAAAACHAQSSRVGDVMKNAGAVVEIQSVARILIGYVQVQGAVLVHIRPDGGAGARLTIADARPARLFAEAKPARLAVEQIAAVQRSDKNILITVVIHISGGSALIIVDQAIVQ
ncbi:MAG: hypothetical protein BWY83_02841 [bacterium ADurb.Bin478]|nr:MAG: hypothetical protein BWY83_02841 [bacterium ADurb.Bin478]